jgi:protoporphyrinogen/coproporphyrinogen III oxidase
LSAGRSPTIVVVGGGIAGLSAAWELVREPGAGGSPSVVVLEAAGRLGGKLQAEEFAGRTVDVAGDAFLARRPEATELCEELGITHELVPVGAAGASIWARGRLRPMPEGSALGVPTRWWPLARSRILSPAESLRVARDLVAPHRGARTITGDRAVGEIVGARLGRPAVDRLVDPLIGGIHAGDVDELSAAATFPLLLAADQQPGSLMRRLRRVPNRTTSFGPSSSASSGSDPAAPAFWSLRESTASLAERLRDALEQRGVTLLTGARADALRAGAASDGVPRWTVDVARPEGDRDGPPALETEGVVLAVDAPEAARLLRPLVPAAASLLAEIDYSSVVVVTMSLPEGAVGRPLRGTGFLVPRASTVAGRRALMTGCTFLARKWPHLARPGDELVRVSTGRAGDERPRDLDDDELVAAAFDELAAVLDVRDSPVATRVTRWDQAFPQYRVGHLIRVATVERSVATLGAVAVAGAAYRGVGIPACIASGRTAARAVLTALAGKARGGRPAVEGNGAR